MISNLQAFKNTHFSEKSKLGKKLLIVPVLFSVLFIVGCGEEPMTDADMAAKYGLSLEAYQEQKEAAARMNMSVEDHLNMGHSDMNHDMDSVPESEMNSHEKAAAGMGMTLEEHEAAGHPGH